MIIRPHEYWSKTADLRSDTFHSRTFKIRSASLALNDEQIELGCLVKAFVKWNATVHSISVGLSQRLESKASHHLFD